MRKKIAFIAQFPPPIHGLSKAVETLYNSELKNDFEFEKIDITNNKKFLFNLKLISKSRADLYYFTISQTRFGNIRDLIILSLLLVQKKKCIIHLHGGYYRNLIDNELFYFHKIINYKIFSRLEGAIVLGDSLKTIFKDILSEDKIFIVPNCVDNEFLISDEEFKEKIESFSNKKIINILYLSNFIKTKGYLKVLELARLEKNNNQKDIKYHFHFAGSFFEKEDEKQFFEYIMKFELSDYITYHGIVKGDKKQKLLKICDVFVLLTNYPKEGQPISILEAMGNGMLIMTTNHAGIPDIVENNSNGIVVDSKNINIEECYELLNKSLCNQEVFEQISISNRKIILSRYSETNYIINMKSIFK